MTNLIPITLKNSVEHLRENVMDTFDRWIPERLKRDRERQELLWPSTIMTMGGPAIDVTEDAEAVYVRAELPGLSEKDFSVELEKSRLLLRGEKKESRERHGHDGYFAECAYGSFARSIPLPCEIDSDKAVARYTQGVLTVTLPKTTDTKGHRIRVNIAA